MLKFDRKRIKLERIDKLTSWSFLIKAYCLIFPFSLAVSNIFIGVFLAKWLVSLFQKKSKLTRAGSIIILLFIGFYLIGGVSLIYSIDRERTWELLYRNIPILMYPIIFFTTRIHNKDKVVRDSLLLFSISVVIINFLSLITSVFNWYRYLRDEPFLQSISLNEYSSAIFSYDYLYLGLFTSFALLFLLTFSLRKENKKYRKVGFVVMSFLFLSLFLIGGRNSIISTTILGFLIISIDAVINKKYSFLILSMSVLGLLLYLNIQFNTYFKERVSEVINYENKYNIDEHWGGRGVRLEIWDCTYALIKERPLLGVGLGDSQIVLDHCYYENNISSLIHFDRIYNVHNQFLQVFLETGVIGLVLFVLSCLYPLVVSFRRKNYYHLLFIIVSILFMLTESIFHRNMGIVFFAFFHSFLFSYNREES
jgi:O-antigen ligase